MKHTPSSAQSSLEAQEQASFEAQAWVGIDVSKDTLDAALSLPGPGNMLGQNTVTDRFPNDKKGFANLLK